MEGMISLIACEHCVQSEINDSHNRLSTVAKNGHSILPITVFSILSFPISDLDFLLRFVRTAGICIAICDSGKETVL